ncbi:uncharacterized protein I303_108544 [Kwoniella dejecticola CBS 10117]|uniref:Kri1-like C-terminal domain-containing protein n=1 Tax=Kwoniella dejecticola CBS 10117 TaxID=1296121 RepID=A0A1A5ZX37_9TREE|nr:uncharacterized protein I303_07132 [Kwoniella dejecticola CBS 10117]OBR82373.1 hypothetical protein I303_07132 [Kwoniella dejecticola CBS 10117]
MSGSEYGSESDYSSSDVTEDEDGDELTPALDAAILRTLSKIKRKEGVYGQEDVLQEELKRAQEKAQAKGIKTNISKKVAEKPYLLQDYHRAKLLAGDNGGDDEQEDEKPLTYVESRRKIQEDAITAFKLLADDESDEEGDFITKREKGEGEDDMEEAEYRQFLLEMGGGEDEVRKILGMGDQPISTTLVEESITGDEKAEKTEPISKAEKAEQKAKKKAKKERKTKNDDEFLMNYILNRGWIDRSEKYVPTYKEVVGDDESDEEETENKPKAGPSSHPWGELDEEDEFDDKADAFEAEYNFRFEEPGGFDILSHPRQIDSLVRRPDDARKSKRARKAERKAAERAAQEESLKAKKGSKRREMERSMAALKMDLAAEGVEGEVDWDSLEKVLDGEWDENEWEKVVGGMLSRAGEQEDENGKPVWDDDIGDAEYDDPEEGGQYPYEQAEDTDVDAERTYDVEEEGPINMDADFIDEEPSKKKRKKDKKKKGKALEVETEIDPKVNGLTVADKAKKVKEAMEEYKALDHEDMIGDMPTKFKYTHSAPVSFGLTPAEILLATDEELNKVLNVKSIAPYRKGGIGMQGRGLGSRVRELKEDLKRRRWGQDDKSWKEKGAEHAANKDGKGRNAGGGGAEGGEKKRAGKRKGKKERQKAAKAAEEAQTQAEQ